MHKDLGDALVELIKSRRRLRQPDYAPNSVAVLKGRLRMSLRACSMTFEWLIRRSLQRRYVQGVLKLPLSCMSTGSIRAETIFLDQSVTLRKIRLKKRTGAKQRERERKRENRMCFLT